MLIRPIDAVADHFSAWYNVHLRALRADYPNGPHWREREMRAFCAGDDLQAFRLWVAEHDGDVVGAASLRLPRYDNTKLGEVNVYVRPDARRRGVGTRLLRVVEAAAGNAGRTKLLSYLQGPACVPATSGIAFVERHGFTARLPMIARVQRAPFDLRSIAAAEDEARPRAAAHRIVTWRDRAPEELLDELARLEGRMSTDEPLGGLEFERERWDATRVRVMERRRAQMGRSTWTAVAVAPDGSLAGITVITVSEEDHEVGHQETTIVDPVHRGHRLGLMMKAANLRALLRDRPGVQAIWTQNAASNMHMIDINDRLGYRVEGWSVAYQRPLHGVRVLARQKASSLSHSV